MIDSAGDNERRPAEVGRRCHVTLLFSDLCDYTSFSEACDPELVATLLETVKATARRVIVKHRGTLNQFYGDGFLAVFGLPAPGEDDVRCAAEAALEVHEAVRNLRFDFELPPGFKARLHTGIHSGLVFARDSDPEHGRYELIGDPVNTAARLCAAAAADEILASEVTLRAVAPFFETDSVSSFLLKGKEDPVAVYRVLRRSSISTRFEARTRRGLTPFVGRTSELERLSHAMSAVLAGNARFVQVVGDAGVGKTRLMEEFRKRSAPLRASLFAGSCESYGNVAPLQPFRQVLRQLFALVPQLTRDESIRTIDNHLAATDAALVAHQPALLQALSLDVAPPGRDPDSLGAAVSGAVTALIVAHAMREPVVLLLDDWQWADDASHQVMVALLQRLAQEPIPILVVTASRALEPRERAAPAGDAIDLRPFNDTESANAIRALLPNALELSVTEVIHQRSGGNALFLEELCQSWLHDSAVVEPISRSVPNTVHGLIQMRVERLPQELAAIARAAAVIGSEFEQWLLERLVENQDVSDALKRLAGNNLIFAGDMPGTYRYKHGITREVVYNSVKLAERRRLHAVVARAIEECYGADGAVEHYEALAYHYAGAADPERAARYAELAGDKAAATYTLDRARQQYRAAMTELEKLSAAPAMRRRWLDVTRKWALSCVYSPAVEQIDVLTRILEHTEALADQDAIARSHYWLGWIDYTLGEQQAALVHSHRALELAEKASNARLGAQLLANLGQIYTVSADCSEGLSCLERAMGIKREQAKGRDRPSVPVGFVYAMGCKGVIHGYLGDYAEAYGCLDAALDTVQGAGHAIEASLLGLLGLVLVWQGRFQDCLDASQRMRATAQRVRGPYLFAMSQTFGGYARWMLRRDPADVDEVKTAVDWLEDRKMRLFYSFSCAHLGEALASAGDLEGARRYAERALERADQLDRTGEVLGHVVLARCARSERNQPAMKKHLEDALAASERRGSPRETALVRLEQAALAGRELGQTPALKLVSEAREAFEAMGMAWHIEQAERIASEIRAGV